MIDLAALFKRWWKLILLFTVVPLLLALSVALLLPKKYLSTTTAFPVNSATADRARLFNNNLQSLYSIYGDAAELDKLEGTAKLDTIYTAVIQQFGLVQHYNINPSEKALAKAVNRLKKHVDISKTGYGQFRIKAWDEDKIMAAAIANSLMDIVQNLHQQIQTESNAAALKRIREESSNIEEQLKKIDSSSSTNARIKEVKTTSLLNQLQQYEQLSAELQLMINASTPVLLVAERAKPATWADKPNLLHIAIFTFFGALLFSVLLTTFLQTKRDTVA